MKKSSGKTSIFLFGGSLSTIKLFQKWSAFFHLPYTLFKSNSLLPPGCTEILYLSIELLSLKELLYIEKVKWRIWEVAFYRYRGTNWYWLKHELLDQAAQDEVLALPCTRCVTSVKFPNLSFHVLIRINKDNNDDAYLMWIVWELSSKSAAPVWLKCWISVVVILESNRE